MWELTQKFRNENGLKNRNFQSVGTNTILLENSQITILSFWGRFLENLYLSDVNSRNFGVIFSIKVNFRKIKSIKSLF
ncbi:hypothetical protein A1343_19110 [Leptospira interrogans serovar Bataviae]|nr:hypothetical protein A1343_19110 [Leptospira interrogans serovar Bataviae]